MWKIESRRDEGLSDQKVKSSFSSTVNLNSLMNFYQENLPTGLVSNDLSKLSSAHVKILLLGLLAVIAPWRVSLVCGQVINQTKSSMETINKLPKEKETTLGLYVTASEAYAKWKASAETTIILDVRTAEECLFVGHATMAWNVPVLLQVYTWDSAKQRFPMKANPDFITGVNKIARVSDTLFVMCRSGGRSAMAVNQLAAAGFKNVYNIIDGMEGDAVGDPESVFYGQRLKNGWKNSGLPWTYAADHEKMFLPALR
jgi:rhodanese-related sulfurtransferase